MQQGTDGNRSAVFFWAVLAQGAFLAGQLVFIAAVGIWRATLFRRFSRVP